MTFRCLKDQPAQRQVGLGHAGEVLPEQRVVAAWLLAIQPGQEWQHPTLDVLDVHLLA